MQVHNPFPHHHRIAANPGLAEHESPTSETTVSAPTMAQDAFVVSAPPLLAWSGLYPCGVASQPSHGVREPIDLEALYEAFAALADQHEVTVDGSEAPPPASVPPSPQWHSTPWVPTPCDPTPSIPETNVPLEPQAPSMPPTTSVPATKPVWEAYWEKVERLNAEMEAASRYSDPLVFDLNGDGDTDATVDQRGIEVDGATATKWAEAGDGVLAFGGEVLDTDGGRYADAYANLRARAAATGIDVAKGHLDASDLAVLEARGLALLVSNGDGTNRSARPTELGISRIELSGQAVDKQDAAGNRISAEGSFVRDGRSQRVNDMWFKAHA